MRLMSFEKDGHESYGIVAAEGVIDAGARLDGLYPNLKHLLAAGNLEGLDALGHLAPDHSLDDVRFLPPIADPAAKILCVGINYLPHITEMGRDVPEHPVLFVRFMDSLVGHREALVRPCESEKHDYEGELAVIIGRRARRVRRADALSCVAGYSCFNDGSVRDFQRHGPQWTAGKNFHASGAFGPWLVTADEQPDPTQFHLTTRLNDQVVQDESVANLCFDVPALIEYCSTWTQLEPGDVIVTGTPGGVGAGRTPRLWLKPGDIIEVEISGIGTLRNQVADDA